jgi:hypothetical protein
LIATDGGIVLVSDAEKFALDLDYAKMKVGAAIGG